jgi:hypothetical protein
MLVYLPRAITHNGIFELYYFVNNMELFVFRAYSCCG